MYLFLMFSAQSVFNEFKGLLPGCELFMATESPLTYFNLRALFVPEIFEFLS